MTDPAALLNWRQPDYSDVWAARLERAAKISKAPAADLAALKAYYSEHPADWITDWGMTFDPRNPERGLPAMAPFILFPKQREAVEWIVARWRGREDGLVEKSRDMGVSWLCVAVAAWMWTFHPGVVVGFGSRKEDYVDRIGDPSSLFWKIRAYIRLLPPFFRPHGYNEDKHAPFMRVLNPENGASIIGEAGSNIGRGARSSIYFKDESAFYEQAESIDAALSQTSNCKIDVSTPNGEGNPFWRKRMGGKVPVFVFDWRDDPRKGQDWYDKQRRELDPVVLAQEVDRDYSASVGNSFIAGDMVTDAMGRGPADLPPAGPIRMGLDVARFGDDKTVLVVRRGRVVLKVSAWGKTDLMSTAGRVRQEVLAYRGRGAHIEQIAVDTIGIGAGVADALRGWITEEGVVRDVNASLRMEDGKNYNLRAAMWDAMKDWIAAGCSLPNDQDMRADLTGLRYGFRQGLLLLESKDDAKKRGMKSPDRADALALTFAIPGGPKPQRQINPGAITTYPVDAYTGM
jgi:phage terminase large subunit